MFIALFEVLQQVMINELLLHLVLQEWLHHSIKVLSIVLSQVEVKLMAHKLRIVSVLLIRA